MVSENEIKTAKSTIKYLCSYGGKIAPRLGDGQLRYVGGHTRVFSADRSLSFAELMVNLAEFCGQSVELRCQLPNGDLETLISINCYSTAIGYSAGGFAKGNCGPRYPIGTGQRVLFGCDTQSRRIWH
ncbi:hypothetical protein LINPERPRIM_LOCUS36653 [Linum perenne]